MKVVPIDKLLSVGAQSQLDVETLLARELSSGALRLAAVLAAVLRVPRASVLFVLGRAAYSHRPGTGIENTY